MNLLKAKEFAERAKSQLAPYCSKIEIAGSIRRNRTDPGDIDIVAIPKETPLFEPGIETVLDSWWCIKGKWPCKYTQRILPDGKWGVKLEIHFATENNFGLIYFIRTGSADFSHNMASAWAYRGFHGYEGRLYYTGRPTLLKEDLKEDQVIKTPEEEDIFRICGRQFVKPEFRI
jgi:DNA polymerase/3'-5' exonuclease PolX